MYYLTYLILIRPIFTYGNDVWGLGKIGIDVVDEIVLKFLCCTLSVKATTCNAIVYGECERYPLSVFCHINVLLYLHRLWTMPGEKIVKSVFQKQTPCTVRDFRHWSLKYTIWFKIMILIWICVLHWQQNNSKRTKYVFVENWHTELHGRLYKHEFSSECYLDYINVPKFRISI